MPIVVTTLRVVSVFENGKSVLFLIVYENYSMKALLNIIRVVFINHQGIMTGTPLSIAGVITKKKCNERIALGFSKMSMIEIFCPTHVIKQQ